MANILLGIPSGGSVKSKTMMTIISVISMTQHRITVMERDGALGPDNRNHIYHARNRARNRTHVTWQTE